jgi:hypothetical protein
LAALVVDQQAARPCAALINKGNPMRTNTPASTRSRTRRGLAAAAISVAAIALPLVGSASADSSNGKGRNTAEVSVYVTGQGLTYESIVVTDLPMNGPFQQLIPNNGRLETEFGPGDTGYVGGRWWLDANDDGEMNEGDAFFLCPLLGSGH